MSIWLDTHRFPTRAFLASVARHHAPLDPSATFVHGALADVVRRRWALHLGVDTEDLLLAATEAEAFRLVLHGLLAPGDVAIVAEPAPVAALGAVLAAGAQYVDLGRLHDGTIDAKALHLAVTAHPQAVVVGEQPSLFGTDDRDVLRQVQARARVIDARHAPGWAGPADLDPEATATIIALRDPDQPAAPVLHGIVCAAGTGPGLSLLQGPATWPDAPVRQALAVLDGLRDQPAWPQAAEADLTARHAAFVAAIADLPGVEVLPRAGFRVAAQCLAGDAAAVARFVTTRVAPVDGFGAQPMRSLVVARLNVVQVMKPA